MNWGLVLILIHFYTNMVYSQDPNTDSVRVLFNKLSQENIYLYQNDHINEINFWIQSIYSIIEVNKFSNNMGLKMCLDSNIQYLDYYIDTTIGGMDIAKITKIEHTIYLKSLNFNHLTEGELADTLLSCNEIYLLKFLFKTINFKYLATKLSNLNNCDSIEEFLNLFYYDSIGSGRYFNLTQNNLNKVRGCNLAYSRYLLRLKMSNLDEKDSLLEGEYNWFIINDTSNVYAKYIINQIYGDEPDSLEINIRNNDSYPDDSTRTALQQLRENEEKLQDSLNEISHWENLSEAEKHQIYVASDTMLWEDGYPSISLGDDGMRFDSLTNEELFVFLTSIDAKSIYDTIKFEYQLNGSPDIIHLRKVFQLLGDRYVYGLFTPNDEQIGIIDNYMNLYSDFIVRDSSFALVSESKSQIIRLWDMVIQKHYQWIDEGNTNLFGFVSAYLNPILNENIIIEMINNADAAQAQGDEDKALRYILVISNVYYSGSFEDENKLKRRPGRNEVETERLANLYVIPAMKRYNLLK
ncbi:MAG: hypothetical protein IPG95_06205 [Saprospiraceae bacterium]|nr:hypothetical protein [Saprospiraceae bacterium]